MDLKGWLRGGGERRDNGEDELEVEDLITLERYEEAEARLRRRLKRRPRDLHSRMRLADVLLARGRGEEAVAEYLSVADSYAGDGFYNKAEAVVTKLVRLQPANRALQGKLEALRQARRLEGSRDLAAKGLIQDRALHGEAAGTAGLELQRLWNNLQGSALVQALADPQLRRLFGAFRLEAVEAGAVLGRQGERRGDLLLIAEGSVDAVHEGSGGRETVLRSFAPGDVVGESVLLERGTWPATYRAARPSRVLRLDREALEQALQGNPDPRAFLDALRQQRHDSRVRAAIRRLR